MLHADRIAIFALAVAVCWGVPPSSGSAAGEEFRVDNKVFMGAEKEPKVESTTIFHQGLVYDYIEKAGEISILDSANHRFILLDTTRRVKTQISTDEIQAFSDNFKQWASEERRDEVTRFLANPGFTERQGDESGQLLFDSTYLTYRVSSESAASEEMARQYREFSDWYAKLNTRTVPGYKQAFARMAINEALEKRHWLPREVQFTLKSRVSFPIQKATARSVHQVARGLAQRDRDRIAQTDQYLAMFQSVSVERYLKHGEE